MPDGFSQIEDLHRRTAGLTLSLITFLFRSTSLSPRQLHDFTHGIIQGLPLFGIDGVLIVLFFLSLLGNWS